MSLQLLSMYCGGSPLFELEWMASDWLDRIGLDWTGMAHGCVFSLLSTQEDFQGRISAASVGYVLLFVYSRSHSLDLAGAKGVDFVSGGSTEASCLISRKQSFRFIGISPQLQKTWKCIW